MIELESLFVKKKRNKKNQRNSEVIKNAFYMKRMRTTLGKYKKKSANAKLKLPAVTNSHWCSRHSRRPVILYGTTKRTFLSLWSPDEERPGTYVPLRLYVAHLSREGIATLGRVSFWAYFGIGIAGMIRIILLFRAWVNYRHYGLLPDRVFLEDGENCHRNCSSSWSRGRSLVTRLCFLLDVAGIWAALKCDAVVFVPGLLSSLSLRFAQSQRLASRRFPLFSLSQVNSSVLNPFHAKLVCVALRICREEWFGTLFQPLHSQTRM